MKSKMFHLHFLREIKDNLMDLYQFGLMMTKLFHNSFLKSIRCFICLFLMSVTFLLTNIYGTPMSSFLDLTLSLSGELLNGNQNITVSLFDERFSQENIKWTQNYPSIQFSDGHARIQIGPLNETDLLINSPNIHIQIGDESVIIELDSRFYAIQSKLSEKTMQLYHTDALFIDQSREEDKRIGIGTGVTSNLSDKVVLNGNLKFIRPNTGIIFDGMSSTITSSASFEALLTPLWTTTNTGIYYNQGNVGIGVNNPQEKLHVSGNIKIEGLSASTESTVLVLESSIIKTRTLPASSFAGFENNPLGIFTSSTPEASLEVHPTSSLNNIFIARPNSTSSSGLFVKNSGKVGIGSSAPNALLDIVSNGTDMIFSAKNINTNKGLHVLNNGKVGINTITPESDLDVSGNINVTGVYKMNNVVYFNSPSTSNLFVAVSAGENYTAGNNNTFLGNKAGFTQTAASNNTFVGYKSGYNNSTGENNTAVGAYSLHNNENNDNTAIGFAAGYQVQTGSKNTIIGTNAAASANAGIHSNVIIGYEAGKNMMGHSNTLIGYQSGQTINGNNNILIGYQSGKGLTNLNNTFMISDERGSSRKILLYGDLDNQKLAIATTNLSATNKSLFVDGIVEVEGIKYPDGTIQRTYLGSETGYVWQRDGQNIYFPAISGGNVGSGTVKIGTAGSAVAGNPRLLVKSASTQRTVQIEGNIGDNNAGGSIHFGDGGKVYLKESSDDELDIYAEDEMTLSSTTINIVTSGNLIIPSLNTTTSETFALVIDSNNLIQKRDLGWAFDSNNSNIHRVNGSLSIGTTNASAKLVIQNSSSSQDILKLEGDSSKRVLIDSNGNLSVSGNLTVNGDLSISGAKTFIIDHPIHSEKYLIHATLEGPESAVYYRGKGKLVNGKAVIKLPNYFETLTHLNNRTVQLNSENGWAPLFVEGGVKDAQFTVRTTNDGNPNQEFNWIVTAERKDISKLEVEPLKSSIKVHSFGPYTYSEKIK